MKNISIDSESKFRIYSSFTLSNDDISVLSLLYAPLIGSKAFMLYLGLESLLERNNLKSEELTHKDFYEIYSMNSKDFLEARKILEGIGLLITYYNEELNNYIYTICPPLTAKNFIKDVTLGLYLYAKVNENTFNMISKHFQIEKIDKAKYENITASFDQVFESNMNTSYTAEKFSYLLGRKPNNNLNINNTKFDFDLFTKEINIDFLESGITKQFKDQITNLAFVYGFNEIDMAKLYTDSIDKRGIYSYRLLKKNANILFKYRRNMNAPKLDVKSDDELKYNDLVEFLDNASPIEFLSNLYEEYPDKYLDTINDIYVSIELPRGVINCMILKVIKELGELPHVNYFKKMAKSWISDNIFQTIDAINYITTAKINKNNSGDDEDPNGGFDVL